MLHCPLASPASANGAELSEPTAPEGKDPVPHRVGFPSPETCPELLSLSKEQLHNPLSHLSFLLKTSAVPVWGQGWVFLFVLGVWWVFLLSRIILLFSTVCDVSSRLLLRKTAP